jgi:hypothetical protein
MNKKLTLAQAEVIWAIESEHWLSGENPTVPQATQLFPNRDNLDNARRRTFSRLVKDGYFKQSTRVYQSVPGDLYEADVPAIRDAWNEWWKSQGFRDLHEIFRYGY